MVIKKDGRLDDSPRSSVEPSSLGISELLRDLPPEAQNDAAAGTIIKDVGNDMPPMVLVSGLVRVERDITTPNGIKSVVVDSILRDDLFNEGALLPSLRENARQYRYVAETNSVYLTLTLPNLKGATNLPRAIWAFLIAKIKRGVALQNALTEQLAARANLAPATETDTNGRDIAQLKEEIARLRKEVDELKLDAEWSAPSENTKELEQEVAELREAINSERAEAIVATNVLAAQIERLEPVARQKAHDAWTELSQSETVAAAVVDLSNFVYELLAKAGVSPTRQEVAHYRELLQQISWRFSEQIFAKLADIGLLTDDDVATLTFSSVGAAVDGEQPPDSEPAPRTQRYPCIFPPGPPSSQGKPEKAPVSAPPRSRSYKPADSKERSHPPSARDTYPYDLGSSPPPEDD
ncbi:hypothetical protein KKF59_01780 [Patescibacteria group bacterium]|nr:hypothetical protein [Patescibacteria group bacterium]MBU1629485.1 hypothetical protein [Patescibacteria group bacterium]MBU1907843.1 hypothetical protein [Patescibacteria group bacterium]